MAHLKIVAKKLCRYYNTVYNFIHITVKSEKL